MRNTRRFRLGLFVLGTGVMFVALLVFIMQRSFNHERATYYIMFSENVKGMVIGSKVNFQGVPIGVVKDMRFQDGNTLVELSVDPSRANIQDVTRARMDRLLVTGQVSVELEGYAAEGKSLPADSFIEPKEDPMNSLKASLPEVVLQARHLADDAMPQVGALLADARRTMQAAEGTANAATGSAEAMTATLATVERLEADLHGLLRESTAIVTGVRGPALATITGFRSTLDDLRGLLRQLKLAPDSLLFGVNHPAAPAGGR